MSVDVTVFTVACGAGEFCRHQICRDCGRPIRRAEQRAADHPGTRVGAIKASRCVSCRNHGGYKWEPRTSVPPRLPQSKPEPSRKVVMARLKAACPGVHALIVDRQNRGIPEEGNRR